MRPMSGELIYTYYSCNRLYTLKGYYDMVRLPYLTGWMIKPYMRVSILLTY